MKKCIKTLVLSCIAASVFLTGCASAKIDVPSLDKMAVITIGGNSHLPWYEKVDGKEPSAVQGVLSKTIDNLKNSDNPEIRECFNRLDYSEESLKRNFEEILGVTFVDKEQVLSSKRYRAMSEGLLHAMNTTITADGYRDIRSPDKYNMRKLAAELDANSFVVIHFEFFKKITKGTAINGLASPYVKMKVKLYDREGKEIKAKTYVEQGSETVETGGRNWDKEKLVAMYPEVIDRIMAKFALDLLAE